MGTTHPPERRAEHGLRDLGLTKPEAMLLVSEVKRIVALKQQQPEQNRSRGVIATLRYLVDGLRREER